MLQNILLLTTIVAILVFQADAIDLGGTEVPKDKFIVYLLIGHSQMAGVITTNNDNVTHPHAWVYRWATTKTWELAKETGSLRNGLSGRGTGGPGMPFLKQLVNRHSDYYFGVISNADPAATCHGLNTGYNGSNLTDSANRYWRGMQLFEEIITAARAVQKDATLGGFLVMLGTIEATRAESDTVCWNFSSDMAQMAKDMRDSLGVPNLPFIVADYEKGATGDFSVSNPWPAIIAEQIDSVPIKLSNSVEINSAGIPLFDDHHFTIPGQGEWARRAVDSIEAKHFFPPPTAGVLEKPAVPKTEAAGKIVVSYGNGRVKIEYRPVAASEAVLSIYNLDGKCLLRQRMTGAGGTLSAVLDNNAGVTAQNGGGCYIAKIKEAKHQGSVKIYSIR